MGQIFNKLFKNPIESPELVATPLHLPANLVTERVIDVATTSIGDTLLATSEKLVATPQSLIDAGFAGEYSGVATRLTVIPDNFENNNLNQSENTKIFYKYEKRSDLLSYLQLLDPELIYGLDIETTGLRAENSKIALIQIYHTVTDEVSIFRVLEEPISDEEQQLLAGLSFVAHNASFERSFMPYLQNLECSMIAYHAATSDSNCGLGELSNETGISYANKKDMQKSDWSAAVLTAEQLEYATKDAKATYLLWNKYCPGSEKGNKEVYDRMLKASLIVDAYAKRGLPVDAQALQIIKNEKEQERDTGLATLREMGYGHLITPKGFSTKKNKGTGKQLTDELPLEAKTIVERIRSCHSYINNIIAGVKNNIIDSRLPLNVKICGTETGRFSSSNPNTQNFPRQGFRHIFKATEGRVLIKADFAGQELRMAAAISNEKVMFDAFNEGKDLHAMMAAKLNNVSIEVFNEQDTAWKKAERRKAKAANFGFLYGMGAKRFVDTAKANYGVDLTLDQAENIKQTFWKSYPTLRNWCDKERDLCYAVCKFNLSY